ncbi:MAG TPA: 2OG-Fe(II) oxygenase family protein [Pseudomonadales bacterium]|nr:2OG-Fe(II) oxygenase family protein [Pseudomonadales bacterium]
MAEHAQDPSIPVVDAQWLMAPGRVRAQAVRQIAAAAEDWGFFQLIGHGVPRVHRERLLRAQRGFFDLPMAHKLAVARSAANARGYNPGEFTKNRRDAKEIFDFGHKPDPAAADDAEVNRVVDGWNQFPTGLAGFRETTWRWYGYCESLAFILLGAFAEGLGLPGETLERGFGAEHTSFLRLNDYPPQDDPAPADAADLPEQGRLGIHHHTDAGVLTLLIQEGMTALQVRRHGRWHLVEPEDDAFIVNIGDMMQVVSNDRFKAPEHRVLATPAGGHRQSAAFFFNPAYDALIAPDPLLAGPAARYRPFTWGEFRSRRADGDYADLGEEVQISQYRRD